MREWLSLQLSLLPLPPSYLFSLLKLHLAYPAYSGVLRKKSQLNPLKPWSSGQHSKLKEDHWSSLQKRTGTKNP